MLLGVNFPDPDIASWATTGKPLPPEPSELLDSNEPPVVKRNTPGLYSTSMDDERLGDDDQDESTSLGRRKTAPAPDTRIGFETPAPDKAKAAIANGGATAERAGGVGGGGGTGRRVHMRVCVGCVHNVCRCVKGMRRCVCLLRTLLGV